MKKAAKILHDFFKKADCDDGNDSGSTSVLTDLALREYKEPTEKAKEGLHSDAAAYPRGKTPVCSGKGCAKPATGGGLLCDSHRGLPKGTLETKEPGKVQYVDKYTQNQIWKNNKNAYKLLNDFFKE